MNMIVHKHRLLIAASIISCLAGILFYSLKTEMLIVRWPHKKHEKQLLAECARERKMVTLFYWLNDSWQTEKMSLIWDTQTSENIRTITNQWIALMGEEKLLKKSFRVESVLLSANEKEAYLSFNRSPFEKQRSAYEKWIFIESLLKTIRENKSSITHIHLLVHHEPLIDNDLDFSNAWPIEGFLE
jgi:hypothetical protein